MSTTKKLLAIFGATGNQGGSVIDIILSKPNLKAKYALRGISRNADSASSKQLIDRGVEMVSATLNDPEALRAAVKGAYGVYGMTNFWDPDVMDKQKEIQQGKNIFEACKAEGVQHLVFASLPWAENLTEGVLKNVDHFESKAAVQRYAEEKKGEMAVSYYQAAIYMDSYKNMTRLVGDEVKLVMPFSAETAKAHAWPVIDPRAETGKYVAGLFEAGKQADGVVAQAVSAWFTVDDLLAAISKEVGRKVEFMGISQEDFEAPMPSPIGKELAETMRLVGEYSYFGLGEEAKQKEHDKWLVERSTQLSLEEAVHNAGPWKFQ